MSHIYAEWTFGAKRTKANESRLMACLPTNWLVAIQNLTHYFLSNELLERSDKSERAPNWQDTDVLFYSNLHNIAQYNINKKHHFPPGLPS